MKTYAVVFLSVFVAELGDKTQLATLFFAANPAVNKVGAVLAGIALMDQLTPDPMEVIQTGDRVRVDPKAGRVEVWPARAPAASQPE